MQSIEDFLASIRASDNTKRNYRNTLNLFCRWSGGHLPKSAAEAQQFLIYQESLRRSPQTVALHSASLKRYMVWAGMPTTRLERYPVVLKEPKYLSKQQVRALLDACEDTLTRCLVAVLYDTGARIHEILGLEVSGVDYAGFLKVRRKGGREDTANITEWGMKYLKEWMAVRRGQHPKVFGDWTYNAIYYMLQKAAKRAGIANFSPHQLRHSRAVHLLDDNPDLRPEDVGYMLGHVNPTLTMKIYARKNPQDLKRKIPTPDI